MLLFICSSHQRKNPAWHNSSLPIAIIGQVNRRSAIIYLHYFTGLILEPGRRTGNKPGTRSTRARKYTNYTRGLRTRWFKTRSRLLRRTGESLHGHFHYVYFSNKGYQMKSWFPNAPVPGSRDIKDKCENFPLRSASPHTLVRSLAHARTRVGFTWRLNLNKSHS